MFGPDSSASTFDSWLKTGITPLLASSYFQTGGDGLLIVIFDEGSGSPSCTLPRRLGKATVGKLRPSSSARSKPGYQSTAGDPANYNTRSTKQTSCATVADALGVKTSGLGGAASADFLISYSGLLSASDFDRSMVRSLFPTGEFFAINRMHSQNPLRSPGAWQAYR